jgi:hypothetical protein
MEKADAGRTTSKTIDSIIEEVQKMAKDSLASIYPNLIDEQAALNDQLKTVYSAFAFQNSHTLHPRRLAQIAAEEEESFLSYLGSGDVEEVFELGQRRAQEGLGEQTVLAFGSTLRRFCLNRMAKMDMSVLCAAIGAIDCYMASYIRGFMAGREAHILKEQELTCRALVSAMQRQRVGR